MKRVAVIQVLFFCLLAMSVSGQGTQTPAQLRATPALDREVKLHSNLRSVDVAALAMEALNSSNVPGGVALLPRGTERLHYSFTPPNRSLKDVLEEIVRVEPSYQWEFDRGVVNLIPRDNYRVLDSVVPEFDVEKVSKEDAIESLMKKSEFMGTQAAFGLEMGGSYFDGPCSREPPKVSIHLKNASVRTILNEVVRQNGRSTWLYEEWTAKERGFERHYYRLNFLVNWNADCGSSL